MDRRWPTVSINDMQDGIGRVNVRRGGGWNAPLRQEIFEIWWGEDSFDAGAVETFSLTRTS